MVEQAVQTCQSTEGMTVTAGKCGCPGKIIQILLTGAGGYGRSLAGRDVEPAFCAVLCIAAGRVRPARDSMEGNNILLTLKGVRCPLIELIKSPVLVFTDCRFSNLVQRRDGA